MTKPPNESLNEFIAEFPIPKDSILMNNAGIAPLPRSAERAIQSTISKFQNEVHFDHPSLFKIVEDCRESLGRLINCPTNRLALTSNCASAISFVAFGLKYKKGEKIIIWDQEYPSNAYPWSEAARRSEAEIEILKSDESLDLDHQKLIERIKPGVRVVALSWVQFQSGVTSPLKEIARACRKVGAYLVVDVIQGVGVIPFDFKDSGVHAACGGSHKWLSGPLGSGFLALSDELFENLEPIVIGANTYNAIGNPFDINTPWFADARRFEPGAAAILNLAGWKASIDLYLKCGVENIHRQSMKLSRFLYEELNQRGFQILGTRDLDMRESPIITFRSKSDSIRDKLYETLKNNRVAFSPRGGGIRFSPHGFNTASEAQQLLKIMDRVSG